MKKLLPVILGFLVTLVAFGEYGGTFYERGGYTPVFIYTPDVPPIESALVLEYLFGANGDEANITLDTSGNSYTGAVTFLNWNAGTNGSFVGNGFYDGCIGRSFAASYITADDITATPLDDQMTVIMTIKPIDIDAVTVQTLADIGRTGTGTGIQIVYGGTYTGQGYQTRIIGVGDGEDSDNMKFRTAADYLTTADEDIWHTVIATVDTTDTNNCAIWYDGEKVALAYADFPFVTNLANKTKVRVGSRNNLRWECSADLGTFEIVEGIMTDADIVATNRSLLLGAGVISKEASELDLDPVLDVTFSGDGSPQDGSTNYFALTDTATTYGDGGVTNAWRVFNGSTSKVDIDGLPIANSSTNYSISLWVNPSGSDSARHADRMYDQIDSASGNHQIDLMQGNRLSTGSSLQWTLSVYEGGYTDVTSTNLLGEDIWNHIAVTVEGTTAIMYQDGLPVHTGTTATVTGMDKSAIGSFAALSAGNKFLGSMDEFEIYDSTLTASNINDYYLASETKFGQLAGIRDESWFGNLKGLYTFNTANSGKSQDYSGNGNHGTDTSVTKSIPEGSWLGNGTTAYTDISDNTTLHTYSNMTLAAWINPADGLANQFIISKDGSGGGGRSYGFYFAAADTLGLNIFKTDASFTVSTTTQTIPFNEWTHVAATYEYVTDGTSIVKMYTNGVPIYTNNAVVGPIQSTATDVNIGRREFVGSPSFYIQKMDNVVISDKTFSDSEIAELYDYPNGGQ